MNFLRADKGVESERRDNLGIVFDSQASFDIEQLRGRLRQMDDRALKSFGEAATYMASPGATADGSPPRDVFRLQLTEARAEWRRRHPSPRAIPEMRHPLKR